MATTEAAAQSPQLHRRALGVAHIVFFIVAASAPLTAVAGGQAVSYLVTGNKAIPFFFVIIGAVLIVFTAGYAAMSHHITNAGAFYAYVARGLGKIPAVATAFIALVSYNTMQIGIYGLFGVALGAFMADHVGIHIAWWGWCLIGWAVIAVMGVLQVDLNAKVLAVLLVLECLVVALFDIAVGADPGPQGLTSIGFAPGTAFAGAVGASLAFCTASFVGFESSAIYGEECRDPRRTVARATYIAVLLVAVFYAISSWLIGVAAGPDTITSPDALVKAGFTAAGGAPDPTTVLFVAGAGRLGAAWGDIASLLFATSLFAALLSFHNAVARYVFALGREGVLPRVCGRVAPRTGAPVAGSVAQSALAVTVVGIFALAGADPVLKLFTWLTTLGAVGVQLLLALASFAVVAFFRRRPELVGSVYACRVAPLVAGLGLAAIFVVSMLNFNVLVTGAQHAPLSSLSIILPAILVGGGLLGLVVGAALRARSPHVYARIGEGIGPDEAPAAAEAAAQPIVAV